MFKEPDKRGVALFMVLGMLLVVVILANVVLAIISSQSRLTHHQVSRIQAHYAAQAGMNYALEKLRQGNDPAWPMPSAASSYTNNLTDSDFPTSIQSITIAVAGKDVPGCDPPGDVPVCVNATVNYTYTP